MRFFLPRSLEGVCQRSQNARRVVRAQHVHQAGKHLRRIVLGDGHQRFAEGAAVVRSRDVLHDRFAPGIVHHAVELAVHEIAARNAVGALIRRVLPDLADQHCVWLDGTDPLFQTIDELIRQLVRHVQAEAVRAEAQPVRDDGVLVLDDVVQIARRQLLDVGQGGHIPPGFIVVGIMAEAIPVAVRRIGIADRAVSEDALRVKVDAVAARMGKHAVKDHADTLSVRSITQGFEVVLRTEHGINALIVGGIIAVIGIRHEDRIHVQHPDAERLQIRQLFPNAVQVAAEEITAPVALFIRAVLRQFVPVFMYGKGLQLIRQIAFARAEKAVWQDLIHHRAPGEFRHGKVRRNHAELPFVAVFHVRFAAVLEQAEAAVRLDHVEPVKIQPALLRGKIAAVDVIIILTLFKHERRFTDKLVVAVFQNQLDADAAAAPRQENPHDTALPRPDRAERGLVPQLSAVIQNTHLISDTRYSLRTPRPRGQRRRCRPLRY